MFPVFTFSVCHAAGNSTGVTDDVSHEYNVGN